MNNNSHQLGLPIEYQQMPDYFDAHNINEQTEATNSLIEKLLRAQSAKTVLDMTCGTGSQVFYLSQRGYEIIGSDFSPALLDIAREKAEKINFRLDFIDGDMRTVKIGKFDAVITIANAIGHLIKTDFETALQNIRANLKDHGIYLFDIFNLQAMTDEVIRGFTMNIETTINGVTIHNVQHSEIDREKSLLISHDHYTILKNNREIAKHTNSFSLQIYTAEELQTILNKNGFEIISQYDLQGNHVIAEKSLNVLTLARKKK